MRILSIDPGYERLGLAVIEKKKGKKEFLLFSECFKTSPKIPHSERLLKIGTRIKEVIREYSPEILATEKLFFSNNQKTALLVAEARGVILYTAEEMNLSVCEYTPADIKMAITGDGRADKSQMMRMIPKLISVPKEKKSDDEFDAIAIGLTHCAIQKL